MYKSNASCCIVQLYLLAGLAALLAANLLAPAEGWDRHPQLEIIVT